MYQSANVTFKMIKSNNSNTAAILIVALFATILTLSASTHNLQTALAHYGVDKDKCKNDEDYYKDHEDDCDKNLKKHYGEDYDGNFGSKSIDDNDNDDNGNDNDDNSNGDNSISQGIGQSQSSGQSSEAASGNNTAASGNNLNLQGQENTGNNAAAQE